MKKTSLLAIATVALMLVGVFAPVVFSTGPEQPPVDTTTLYVGTIAWGPRRADPVRAYDTASGELLFNVYDTLIEMGKEVTNKWGTWDTEEQYWEFEPSLSTNVPDREEIVKQFTTPTPFNPPYDNTVLTAVIPDGIIYETCNIAWVDNNPDGVLGPTDVFYIREYNQTTSELMRARTWQVVSYVGNTLTLHRFHYDFNIRTDPVIHFYDNTGAEVGTLDAEDVVYSIQRGLVQDQYGSPMWMFYKPFFDQMNSDFWDTGDATDAVDLSLLIKGALEKEEEEVRINVGIAFPDVAFKQVISQTWSSILDKGWTIGKGCWNGDLLSDTNINGYPDWFEAPPFGWRHIDVSPIQTISPANYAGTGPYRVITASAALNLVVLQRNPNYWKGWPAPGRNDYLEYVDIEYISDWTARKLAFIACQLDVCVVPRAFMMELLDPTDPAKMTTLFPEIKTIKNIGPVLSMDAIFYCFTVNPISPAIYTGKLPDGIPVNFFNYSNIRKAFSYAFDHQAYINNAWLGEAQCRETPNIAGLVPDYYCYSPDPPWTYNKDINMIKYLLENTFMDEYGNPGGTTSVWDWGGFHLNIYYNAGNDPRYIACQMIRETFDQINAQYGKNFIVDIVGPDWATYLGMMEEFEMPLYAIGWLADFADADNWHRPYMHSYGDFSYFCNYTADNGWASTVGPRTNLTKDFLIDLAVKTPDGSEREDMYKDLDDIYIADNPNMPIVQAFGRRWAKYWVRGWYHNSLYPSHKYYKLFKMNTCWSDVTSPAVGKPEGVTNMRDIGYIADHFGAKAPEPGKPYDDRWAPGTYGNAGCDVYGDRIVNMRDVGFACAHFGHTTAP